MHLLQTEHQPVEVLQLDRVLDMVRLQGENIIISVNHLSSVYCTLSPAQSNSVTQMGRLNCARSLMMPVTSSMLIVVPSKWP